MLYKRNILLGLLIGLGISAVATNTTILFIAITATLLLILDFDEYNLNNILKRNKVHKEH